MLIQESMQQKDLCEESLLLERCFIRCLHKMKTPKILLEMWEIGNGFKPAASGHAINCAFPSERFALNNLVIL